MTEEKQLKELKDVICGWEQVCRDETDKFISALEVSEWEKWHKEFIEDERRHKEDGHNFNVFYLLKDEFGFHVKETMHSKLLKFLLDTNSSHGQGNKFLIEFLKLLKVETNETDIWTVTSEKGRVDILLQREKPLSVIIVENKSNWASDQPNQMYKYWYNQIYIKTNKKDKEFYITNKKEYQILYLSPKGKHFEKHSISRPTDDMYRNLPSVLPLDVKTLHFNDFIKIWLDNCIIQLSDTNHRIREYILQYQMLCKSL